MPYIIGIVLSIAVAVFARSSGFDRDRAFYPTVLLVVASYYLLFASMTESVSTVLLEAIGVVAFASVAVAGFKSSVWIVAAGLAGHGVFDAVHGHLIVNPGVPVWWPAFCATYDVSAAVCLAWLSMQGARTHSAEPRLA